MELSQLAAGNEPLFRERTRGLFSNDAPQAQKLLAPGGKRVGIAFG